MQPGRVGTPRCPWRLAGLYGAADGGVTTWDPNGLMTGRALPQKPYFVKIFFTTLSPRYG